jgi:hypothetical protein
MVYHIGHISPLEDASGTVNQIDGRKVRFTPDGEMELEIWANHVKVKRKSSVVQATAKRGVVLGSSNKSSRRFRWAIENTPQLLSDGVLFVCLTYPFVYPKDGREVKRHLDTFGKRCVRIGAFFAWVLEYQSRGAPHFHLLARFPESWDIEQTRDWIARNWFEVVASGDEKHLQAGTSVEVARNRNGVGFYLSGYLGKESQKTVPEDVTLPGRMWGMIGCRPPKPKTLIFKPSDKKGIWLARLLRRWASSDYAFRQRQRYLSNAEKRANASWIKDSDPKLAWLLQKKPWLVQCYVDVKPEDRISWKPKDVGRDKGFSVRNSTKVIGCLLDRAFSESNLC